MCTCTNYGVCFSDHFFLSPAPSKLFHPSPPLHPFCPLLFLPPPSPPSSLSLQLLQKKNLTLFLTHSFNLDPFSSFPYYVSLWYDHQLFSSSLQVKNAASVTVTKQCYPQASKQSLLPAGEHTVSQDSASVTNTVVQKTAE